MPGVHLWFERKILMGFTGRASHGLGKGLCKSEAEGFDSLESSGAGKRRGMNRILGYSPGSASQIGGRCPGFSGEMITQSGRVSSTRSGISARSSAWPTISTSSWSATV